MPEEYMDGIRAAEFVGVHRNTIRRWRDKGRVTVTGGLFSRTELLELRREVQAERRQRLRASLKKARQRVRELQAKREVS